MGFDKKNLNIAIDDINLFTLSSDTEPSLVVKLMNPVPSGVAPFTEVSIEKSIIDSQIQDIFYISAEVERAVVRSLDYDWELKNEIGSPEKILAYGKEKGLENFIVEQEAYTGTTQLESAKDNFQYMSSLKI